MMRMSLSRKIIFGIAVPLILFAIPVMAQAQTAYQLPNGSTPPALDQCAEAYSTASGLTSVFVENAGYICPAQDGAGGTKYDLFYDNNKNYLGAVQYGTGNFYNAYGKQQPGGAPGYNNLRSQYKNLKCALTDPNTWIQNCFWVPLASAIGGFFISFGGFLLWIVGGIFDLLVQYVIIGFGDTINNQLPGLANAINTGWSVFRDVANILIIGMFVFIAISIILGLKEFGQKKLVAKVIVIAVLINFSLLFTKMIIDFSNFTAFQFYQASAQSYNAPAGSTIGFSTTKFDIASAFVQPLGITSLWNTKTLTDLVAEQSGNSGWAALLYGVAAGTMLAGVAVVLAYGCFQIASRAVALVLLMVTASVAFASYLIPQISEGEYAWKGWWKSLINASIFGPILMIFLFISLQILSKTQGLISKGAKDGDNFGISGFFTGAAAANASPAFSVWRPIFIYILVLGVLYASIKISSHFSSKVGGALVSGVLSVAAAPLALGARFATGVVAQRFLGGAAYGAQKRSQEKAKESLYLSDVALRSGNDAKAWEYKRQADRQMRASQRYGRVAEGKMNVMNTRPAKTLTSAVGLKGFLAGQTTKSEGYSTRVERRAKEAEKLVSKIRPSAEDIKAAEIRTEGDLVEKRRNDRETRVRQVQAARDTAKAALTPATDAIRNMKTAWDAANTTAVKASAADLEREKGLLENRNDAYKDLRKEVRGNPGKVDEIYKKHGEALDKRVERVEGMTGKPLERDTAAETAVRNEYEAALGPIRDLAGSISSRQLAPGAGAAEIREAIKDAAPEQRAVLDQHLQTIEKQQAEGLQTLTEKAVTQQLAGASNVSASEQRTITEQMRTSRSERDSNLRHQAENIERARERAQAIESVDQTVAGAQGRYDQERSALDANSPNVARERQSMERAQQAKAVLDTALERNKVELEQYENETALMINRAKEQIGPSLQAATADIAQLVGSKGWLPGHWRGREGAEARRAFIRSGGKDARLQAALRDLDADGRPPTPPPTTP